MNISVVDGEDLSRFDDVGATDTVNKEDTETLDKLEWELASQSGRLTGIDILLWFLVCLFFTFVFRLPVCRIPFSVSFYYIMANTIFLFI
jgi:hypothetical protein